MRPVDGPQRATVVVDGREAINFSSNNYLGLADSEELRAAARLALEEDGAGSGASRLIVGNLRPHRRLEAQLATFHVVEAALLFNSGYQANVGALSALAGPEDVILSDQLNHASLIDGCRLSRARVEVYSHADVDDLQRRLRASRSARRRFIVTDSVFSMDGDLAPLRELRAVADAHDAALIVDEAHATGVRGPGGRGLAAELGVNPDVHVATFSKAFGGFGAYAAGSRTLVEYLLNRARSFVFTTALPPSVAAMAAAAIHVSASDRGEALRRSLEARIAQFAGGLESQGLLRHGAGSSPIFPVHVGDDRRVMELSDALLARGIFAQGIRPPTVPPGTARLRFSLMATHTSEQIDRALQALSELRP
jgi:8-amino-7-oxononanoate synthase